MNPSLSRALVFYYENTIFAVILLRTFIS